jgi:hypothetical protein
MMPPKNSPRPTRAALEATAAWLETGLDRAAAQRPNPGSPSLHRMNRTEYANAIRDLLDLQVDVSAMLPSDSSSAGFDNIADVLNTSPALIQGYVSAAMKVSRLAVGDVTAPVAPVTYRAARGLSQSVHIDGMPLGTQGGMVARHNFPLNAVYEISAGGARADVTIDGMPVQATGRGGIRLPIPAGPHTISAASLRTFDSAGMDDIFSGPQRGPLELRPSPSPVLMSRVVRAIHPVVAVSSSANRRARPMKPAARSKSSDLWLLERSANR